MKKTKPKSSTALTPKNAADESSFLEIVEMIHESRQQAFQAVNTALIDLYWRVGEYISRKLATAAWGEGVVKQLAAYLAQKHPDIKGFTRPNLFRMRQFFEAYQHDEKVSPLVTQLPWTHNLIILSQCKRPEEREFYLRLCIKERWSKRELERQITNALFERAILNPPKVSALLTQLHPEAIAIFKDTYVVDFLALPEQHSEADLQRGLVAHLRYSTTSGSEMVRGWRFPCDYQVATAPRTVPRTFKPEYLGQLEFYLEALDRDVRKPHERPSIGVLLCASKDDEVVEYALSRSLSPALIAEYQTQLPDKKLLQAKLHEFYEMAQKTES